MITLLWDELYAYSGMKTLKNEIGPITEHVIVILKHLLKGVYPPNVRVIILVYGISHIHTQSQFNVRVIIISQANLSTV